jgi:hypothetical protein
VTIDYEFSLLRAGIVALALVLLAHKVFVARRGRPDALARVRTVALVALALVAYGSYYYFFRFTHVGGLDSADMLQYYVGAKYFPEIGYFGTYDCTLAALVEQDLADVDAIPLVRNLRTLRGESARRSLVRGRRCQQAFTESRWQEFKQDVRWFRLRMPEHQWFHVLEDHGYNPTPVWTLLGRGLAEQTPTRAPPMRRLARADRWVMGVAILGLVLAFGPEVGALAVIAWGTGFPWRYAWVGDAMLRQVWLGATLLGLVALRRRRDFAGGVLLAGAAALRVFPAVFAGGYLLGAAERWWRTRAWREPLRFLLGATLALAVLVPAGAWASGHGFGAYAEFVEKISTFTAEGALNKVGLGVALQRTIESPLWRNVLRVVATLGFGLLFLRALRRTERWEAAALGFAWIPILSDPVNYYYAFTVAGILLAERRPAIGLVVLAACLAWAANGLLFYQETAAHVADSWIAIALSFATVGMIAFERTGPGASQLRVR